MIPRHFLRAMAGAMALWLLAPMGSAANRPAPGTAPIAMVIHGGAGTMKRAKMTPDLERAYREKLGEALEAGYRILDAGGSSLDAVEEAIVVMEDSPLFNAGKGAVFTAQGTNEMDASIMDGKTVNGGAVAAVKRIKNPIRAARLVLEKSWHVLLAGKGAETFAKDHGVKLVSKKYFFTERRWRQMQKRKKEERKKGSAGPDDLGTVGALALDRDGNLAAGTSTGGLTYKRFGRIGDSPILGAGTYADNHTCAVSGTGKGEYFIRLAVGHRIAALMAYGGRSVKEAAEQVVMKDLVELGGSGGVIALDGRGNIATPFNTKGMYRAYKGPDGKTVIKIYKD